MGPVVKAVWLGTIEYEAACCLQGRVAAARARDEIDDALLLLEHPPVITVGRGGGQGEILASTERLREAGVVVIPADRGGRATYHGPGQLVAYPILKLRDDDLFGYVRSLEEVVIRVLRDYGLSAGRDREHPGVWLDGAKIAAVGLAVREGVTRHGLALNVDPRMAHFQLLIPCGIADRGVTSMAQVLGHPVDIAEVRERFVIAFGDVFQCQVVWESRASLDGVGQPAEDQPDWLRVRVSKASEAAVGRMERLLAGLDLHTVCQEARCPNLGECFGRGTATFLILGDTCTRGCRFCAVTSGRPTLPHGDEPERVAEAAARLGLGHVVVTSVTRDDLADGGAAQFEATIRALRARLPGAILEVLIPDFGGCHAALERVLEAGPNVLNHNVETVPRLYPRVRPGADYHRSLGMLAWAKAYAPGVATKSGLMLGLGERTAEVLRVLHDLRNAGCDMLTLGQYLQPSERQLTVARYLPPEEFGWYADKANEMGFAGVASGPLVRSSHRAESLWGTITH